jgi:acetaldehyde dehydrogenase (acetylating)
MKVIVQFTEREEAKALPILYRHSPGMVLRDRIYVLSDEAVSRLREAGIRFKEITREVDSIHLKGAQVGERI